MSAPAPATTTVRALLLTDVVDSTQLSEALGDAAMAHVWQQHDRVARDLLPTWRGREIDKTDGMLLMFERPEDAVGYARAYHHALGTLDVPLRARAGLHVGPVLLRENAAEDVARGAKPLEVDGLAKPTAARIMAIAHGTQTLLSAAAHAALDGGLAQDLAFESHGHWLLKGMAEPLELFEAGTPGGDFRPPLDGDKAFRVVRLHDSWLPVREIPNNLPQPVSRFIGREQELRDIKALLGSARLVTLLGMGGLGKTRLSLQAAGELMHQHPDGVWFLDLSPLQDPQLVLAEAARVLGVRDEPDRTLLQSVCAHLRERRVLMILDNCEHLIKACAELASALLKAAPHLRLAASSREALHVAGEHTYPILPMPLPRTDSAAQQLMDCTAVRLFVDRAQASKPGFTLADSNAAAVAALVARLEGIPLALELAAARLSALSVADLNKRLDDRFKILTGGPRGAQQRQQTLRAMVDWSYDQLEPPEQTLLNRLAVFNGGFGLEDAEAVCAQAPLDATDVLDLLSQLIDKSLVMMREESLGTRYSLLLTIREYAQQKLQAGGEACALGAAHCQHFFAFAKRGRDALRGPEQGEWLERLDRDQDNLRAALAFAEADAGHVDPMIAPKIAVALQGFWILRGYTSEGRATTARLLQMPALQGNDWMRAHTLYLSAALAVSQSDHDAALRELAVCLELRRALDQPFDVAATLSTMAMARLGAGDADGAHAADSEALTRFQQCESPIGEAIARLQLGQIEAWRGNDASAREHLEASLALARRLAHPETEAEAELVLAQLAFEAGDLATADLALLRSLQICTAAGDRRGTANAVACMARLDLQGGRLALARARLADATLAFNAFDMREPLLACLDDHVALALRLGLHEPATLLSGAIERLRDNAGMRRAPRAQQRWSAVQAALQEALGCAPEAHPLWSQARDWDTARTLTQALQVSLPVGRLLGGETAREAVTATGRRRRSDGLVPRLMQPAG